MKPIVIIAIAVVLLIPLSISARLTSYLFEINFRNS